MFRVRYMTLRELCADLWWTTTDYVRAAWQLGIELTRGIGAVRRRKLLPSRKETMPELVLSNRKDNNDSSSQNGSPRRLRPRRVPQSMNRERLEPAFPKDKDYPPGWIKFHPVLIKDELKKLKERNEQRDSEKKENGASYNSRTEDHSQPEKQDCEKERNGTSSDSSSTENRQPNKQDCEKENGHQRLNGVQFHDGSSSSLVVGPSSSSPINTAARCIATSS
jgi:hypothetical protein